MKLRSLALVAGIATLLLLVASRSASLYPPDKTALVNGTSLAYAEAGSGPTVVFVHGAWADTRAWATQRDAISTRYRFVAYSMRYHRPNPLPPDQLQKDNQYSVATHATDLAAFIKSLNVGPVHVVAHSYGGQVAAQLAVEHPELVKTLMLEEPSIYTVLDGSP
ncbi:alpha/beta fold hydrolase [Paraburkholderia sp. 2C]